MSNAEALRRLAQEVIDAHEDRVVLRASILNDIDQIKSETRECQKNTVDLLRTFARQHQEMGKQVKSELEQFVSDLNAAESTRVSNAKEDAGRRRDDIRQRITVVDDLRKDVVAKLRLMNAAHQEMSGQLRAELGRFMSDLDAAESSRLSTAQEDADRRQDDIRQRIVAVDDLRKDVIDKLREITEAHQEMGARLRAELDRFMSDLDVAESSRLSAAQEDAGQRQDEIRQRIAVVDNLRSDLIAELQEMAEAHQEMGKQLRVDLDQFMSGLSQAESNRKAVTQAYLSEVQADIRETATAWKELIHRIQAARAGSPLVHTETAETAPSFLKDEKKNIHVEESIAPSQTKDELEVHAPVETSLSFLDDEKKSTFVEESIASSQTADEIEINAPGDDTGLNQEDIRERIVLLLREHKDGMKMMHIAESLGIENWRSLIPIMRELLDEGALAKEGALYFG
jgi:hypothetical protein